MKEINFNRDWLFCFGENVGDEKSIDKTRYSEIGLPHSFGIPYYGKNDFYVGFGCYHKTIAVDSLMLQNKIVLEFGAVFQVAEIYVNGKFVFKHEGGYTAFICDITDFVKIGENDIFVRVNNNWSPIIAPRAGEHTFNGGIYRDVKVLLYPKSHIAWNGAFIKSHKLNDKTTQLEITTETVNCNGLTLKATVLDAENNVVASAEQIVSDSFTTQNIILDSPHLWDTETPYLYTLNLEVGGDFLSTTFGVRYILWDKDKGFFLNGRRVAICGANVHQDHGGWGDATTHDGIKRDIELIKQAGFNFIRGSHYPHHTEFAKECDRQGILFWSENMFWGIGGFGRDGYWDSSAMPVHREQFAPFEASLKQTLAEMIRCNRNSPSIICWSMCNEIYFSRQDVYPAAKALLTRLVDYTRTLDNSRPVAIGGAQRGGFDKFGDIIGFNGDGATLFNNPPKPNMISEYGSIASYRPGKFDFYETKGSAEYYDWRAGRCIWCGFHHGSIADIGNLGIIDLYRLPLKAYYAYRQKQCGIAPPTFAKEGLAHCIKLTADKTEITTDGTTDSYIVARVYDKDGNRISGNFEITFEVVSGGGLLPTGRKMVFNESLKNCFDGACAIEVRAYFAGKTTIKASADGLVCDQLTIEATGDTPYSGQNLSYPIAPPYTRPSLKGVRPRINIMRDRPVTVSSECQQGS
ncbi:MAG: glycoside hydrolase family 2 TIM barrel-domain containing protein, partial [Clostridia bacterium]